MSAILSRTVCWGCKVEGQFTGWYVADILKDKLFSEDGILSLSGMRLSHLHAVQVDVTVGVGEVLHRQLVGLLHIQHQAAHLGNKWKIHLKTTDHLVTTVTCPKMAQQQQQQVYICKILSSWLNCPFFKWQAGQIRDTLVLTRVDCFLLIIAICPPVFTSSTQKHMGQTYLSKPLVRRGLSGFP